MKRTKLIIAFLLVFVSLNSAGCSKDNIDTFHGIVFPVTLHSDIIIEDGYLYSGEFPEDGSFSQKENVLALKIANNSDKDLRLIRIIVTTNKKEMLFEATTLTAKSKMTVFEKNAQTLEENEKITDIKSENRVDFDSYVSKKSESIELMTANGIFNVKNISGDDIGSDIFVYYKKIDENGDYFGGITFRSKAAGLKNGELKQIPASHFDIHDSKVIFVDYQE